MVFILISVQQWALSLYKAENLLAEVERKEECVLKDLMMIDTAVIFSPAWYGSNGMYGQNLIKIHSLSNFFINYAYLSSLVLSAHKDEASPIGS